MVKKQKPVFKELLERQVLVIKIVSYSVALFFAIVLVIIYLGYDIRHPLITISFGYTIALLTNVLLYRVHNKHFLTYQVLIILSYLEMIALICFTGGIVSPAIFVLSVFPIAAFSTSRKQGSYWSVLVLLSILILYGADNFSIPVKSIVSAERQNIFFLAVAFFAMALSITISYLVNRSTFAVHRAFNRDSSELEEKRKRLDNIIMLVNYSTDLMCVVDLQTLTFDEVNPMFNMLLEYELSEVRGKKITDFINADSLPAILTSDQDTIKDDQLIEFNSKITSKYGKEIFVHWTAIAKDGKLYANAREVKMKNKSSV